MKPRKTRPHVGDIVYAISDPRHVAIVRSVLYNGERTTVNLEWIDTGWKSLRVPVRDLTVVHEPTATGRGVYRTASQK
jgi:hypothetical protein